MIHSSLRRSKRAVAVAPRYCFFVTTAASACIFKELAGRCSIALCPLAQTRGAMQTKDFQFLAESLLSVALAAARVQMAHFTAGVTAATKADKSPVTVADQESEAIIREGLARAAPGVAVVSEEAAAAGEVPLVGGTFFLVDPLDGTRSFIRRDPHFTINIGLIEDRSPAFGLLYAPALDDFYVTVGPGQVGATRL